MSEARFLHALNYCMLLPGPEAQQLATYIGWLMHRTAGGIMAGGLFVLPGIIAIMALSWLYAAYGELPLVTALFFGLKAAVLAIVIEAVVRIGKRALNNDVLRALAAIAFVGIFFFDVPFPLIVLGRGAGRVFRRARGLGGVQATQPARRRRSGAGADDSLLGDASSGPRPAGRAPGDVDRRSSGPRCGSGRSSSLVATLGTADVFSNIATFFSKMAVVTFGGAYAVLAYVAQQAVERYGWLSAGRDARRPRHGGNDAGPADHGAAVRGLHGRVPRPRRASADARRRRSAACSRPGSPSRRASCGSSSARPTSSRCAAIARLPARSRRSPRRSSASSSTLRSGSRSTRSSTR